MKLDGSVQQKTQRGVCSRAHGKCAGPSGYKLSRGEGVLWPVFGTAPLPTGTSVPSPRGEGGLLAGLRHGSHDHRYLSAISAWRRGTSGRSSARPAVSIFGERGDTLRPARTSAYSAPGNTSHRSGARHIQWAPAYSESARRFSRARRRRGMDPRHIHRVPGISRARRHRRMAPRHIQCAPGISRARRRRGCRLCPSHRRGCCRSGWRGWSG